MTTWVEGKSPDGELRTWTIEGEDRPRVAELRMSVQSLYVALDDASVYAELADAQAHGEAHANGVSPDPWCTCGTKTPQGRFHRDGCPARERVDS